MIDSAASLPWFTASIAVFGPVTMSPPANMPATEVARVKASAMIQPVRPAFRSGTSRRKAVSGAWPMARITVSASKSLSIHSLKVGLNMPFSSKTSLHRCTSRPTTFPSCIRTPLGPQEVWTFTPSSIACSISHGAGGHLVRLFQADHMYLGRSQPPRGEGHIDRNVSAADHYHSSFDLGGIASCSRASGIRRRS